MGLFSFLSRRPQYGVYHFPAIDLSIDQGSAIVAIPQERFLRYVDSYWSSPGRLLPSETHTYDSSGNGVYIIPDEVILGNQVKEFTEYCIPYIIDCEFRYQMALTDDEYRSVTAEAKKNPREWFSFEYRAYARMIDLDFIKGFSWPPYRLAKSR